MLRVEHGLLWCWNLDSSERSSGITEKFLMWCWRRMEKISWTDRVRNEEVLQRVKEQRNILHKIKRRKANYIYIFHSVRFQPTNAHNCQQIHNNIFKNVKPVHVSYRTGLSGSTLTAVV
jgi:hypothetical protein